MEDLKKVDIIIATLKGGRKRGRRFSCEGVQRLLAEIVDGRFEEIVATLKGGRKSFFEGVQRRLAEIVDGRFEESRYHCSNTERGEGSGGVSCEVV